MTRFQMNFVAARETFACGHARVTISGNHAIAISTLSGGVSNTQFNLEWLQKRFVNRLSTH
jgi:hypothetical protein